MSNTYDAVVIGSGPNGLAAAITLARLQRSVLVIEGYEKIGGGARTLELTLPGFQHDICSAIHPLGLSSTFFRSLPLEDFGLEWINPPAPFAHPLDDGSAVIVERSVFETSQDLGSDSRAYLRWMEPLVEKWQILIEDILSPFPAMLRHPLTISGFALQAILPAVQLARWKFSGERARALFAGLAGHAILPLEKMATASFGIVEGFLAHAVGWPMVRGGSQKLVDAMAAYLRSFGGEIITGSPVASWDDLPPARAYLFDLTPIQLVRILGERLPAGYRRRLENYRYGPGVFKVDYALSETIPWNDPRCLRAGTLHIGGSLEEIADAEKKVWNGQHPQKPFILFAQQSLFDPGRAPEGKHTAWAYCHVPNGSTVDMTTSIEAQIERFAPGFRDIVLARSTFNTAHLAAYNPNYVGGDIIGGAQDIGQLFTRPVPQLNPYRTPLNGVYLCSSSTPPGGGVHGMCGYNAAKTVIRDLN